MARKGKLDPEKAKGLLQPTAERGEVPEKRKSPVHGVYLSKTDLARVEKVATDLNVSLTGAMKYMIRHFLRGYESGEIRPEFEKTVKMPD